MKKQLTIISLFMFSMMVKAGDSFYTGMEPLKLTTPEMKPELVLDELQANPFEGNKTYVERSYSEMPVQDMDFDFFKSKTNPGVKSYKFMDDMTFVGLPLFVAGWAIKGDKAMFRVNRKTEDGSKKNTQLLSDFKTGIDDYLQFFGPTAVVGLKLAGVEGRSDWPRLLASAALSYGIMAGFVNGIKYTAKEMRPDGSTANSWRSKYSISYAQAKSDGDEMSKDKHSLAKERINGVVSNTDAWYDLFNVREGQKLYLPLNKRAHIW